VGTRLVTGHNSEHGDLSTALWPDRGHKFDHGDLSTALWPDRGHKFDHGDLSTALWPDRGHNSEHGSRDLSGQLRPEGRNVGPGGVRGCGTVTLWEG
jgi:hypothetical protein